MTTFEFSDFEIWPAPSDDPDIEPRLVDVHVEMEMTDPPTPGIKPSLNYPGEPPMPPVYGVTGIVIIVYADGQALRVKLKENEFLALFPGSNDVINNALEWASCQDY